MNSRKRADDPIRSGRGEAGYKGTVPKEASHVRTDFIGPQKKPRAFPRGALKS
jgi:hypothetical protein